MHDLFTDYISEAAMGLMGFVMWLFEYRKRRSAERMNNAQVKKTEILSDAKIVDLYQKTLDDLKRRYDEKIEDLQSEVNQLKAFVNLWKDKYNHLREEFEKHKTSS